MELDKTVLQQPSSMHEVTYTMDQLTRLRQAFEQRWRSLTTRSEKRGLSLLDKTVLIQKQVKAQIRNKKDVKKNE